MRYIQYIIMEATHTTIRAKKELVQELEALKNEIFVKKQIKFKSLEEVIKYLIDYYKLHENAA